MDKDQTEPKQPTSKPEQADKELDEAVNEAVEAPTQPTQPARMVPQVIPIRGRHKRKPKRKRAEVLRKERWFKFTAMFDQAAKSVLKINNEDVVLCGWIPPDMDCSVVLVPTSVTHEQGLALQKIIEAQTRKPVLVLTNNTQLVRLKPITDAEAKRIMEASEDGQGEIVQVQAGSNGEGTGDELRAEGGEPDEGDLRPSEADTADAGSAGGQEQEPAPSASEDEPGAEERPGEGSEGA